MTPTDEFWVRRRILEPRYRNMRSWNLSLGKLPLKIILSGKFFCHHLDCSKLHAQCNFHGEISRNSRVIVKIPFLEHQRFYSMWFRITWHMGIFRVKIYSRIQKYKIFLNPPTQFFKTRFSQKCVGKNQFSTLNSESASNFPSNDMYTSMIHFEFAYVSGFFITSRLRKIDFTGERR